MFERTLEEMTAAVFVENGAAAMAFQYGIADIHPGFNQLTSADATVLILKFDRLQVNVPKRLLKRWLALRNQLIYAFGPDMENHLASLQQQVGGEAAA